MCPDRIADEIEEAQPFLGTGRPNGPDALTPLPSWYASRAPGDEPINHAETKGSFGDVVGRIDIGLGDKGKVVSPVGAKAFGQDGGLTSCFCAAHLAQESIALSFESSLKRIRRYVFALVDELEKGFESIEDALAVVGDDLGRGLGNETGFASNICSTSNAQ